MPGEGRRGGTVGELFGGGIVAVRNSPCSQKARPETFCNQPAMWLRASVLPPRAY